MKPELYRPDLLELAAGYAEDAVIVTTAELDLPGPQFLYVNSAFTKMTGYSAAELLGKTPRILQGKATCRTTLDRLRAELSAGNDFVARTTNYRRDGSEFEIEWIISHIRDSDGKTTHYIAIQRDITGKQRAEEELRNIDQELRQTSEQLLQTLRALELAERRAVYRERLAALGEMAAGVAHDLNNSLSPLLNVLELLDKSDSLSAQEHRLIGVLRQSTDHAMELVQNLRSFYQAEKGHDPTETIDLRELVKSVREITRSKWETERLASGTQIQFDLHLDAIPAVRANPMELRQALVNLVFNAVDAMDSGGVLTISSSFVANEVVIEVADTGCGMSDDVMQRCFEPYFTTKATGNGFGLSVCHGIVAKHGGRMEVNSGAGGGTVFRINLPPENEPETETRRSTRSAGLRILYIDDREAARQSTEAVLSSMGHTVDLADSGDSGLQKWAENAYDILITDLQMTPTTGADVTRVVKAANSKTPVVLLTGGSRDEAAKLFGGHAEPDVILEKPFTLEEIATVLNKIVHD